MARDRRVKWSVLLLTASAIICLLAPATQAEQQIPLWTGQTVYVPVYSHVYYGDRQLPFNLSVNLSLRNTDPVHSITFTSANYYESNGVLIRQYLMKPLIVKPMGSNYLYIKQSDLGGDWGANFVVEWTSKKPVNEPIIEAIMYGALGTHTMTFLSRGKAIRAPAR
jgi:hypothetical protein